MFHAVVSSKTWYFAKKDQSKAKQTFHFSECRKNTPSYQLCTLDWTQVMQEWTWAPASTQVYHNWVKSAPRCRVPHKKAHQSTPEWAKAHQSPPKHMATLDTHQKHIAKFKLLAMFPRFCNYWLLFYFSPIQFTNTKNLLLFDITFTHLLFGESVQLMHNGCLKKHPTNN